MTFSVVDAVALRPLPYAAPERLVDLSLPSPIAGKTFLASPRDYFSWVEGTQAFESLGAARLTSLRLEFNGTVETLLARSVTGNLFDVLGVRPALGRLFDPAHERPGASAVVILSHDVWVRRFGADAGIVGRPVKVNQETREIIGVLPPAVFYPITPGPPTDLYIPYVPTAGERTTSHCCMFVVGRLRPE